MKKCYKCGVQDSQYLSEEKFIEIDGNDYCPYCANKISNNNQLDEEKKNIKNIEVIDSMNCSSQNNKNQIAEIIRIIGFVIIGIGLLVFLILISSSFLIGLTYFIGSFISGIILIGFGEIISLLHKIFYKL